MEIIAALMLTLGIPALFVFGAIRIWQRARRAQETAQALVTSVDDLGRRVDSLSERVASLHAEKQRFDDIGRRLTALEADELPTVRLPSSALRATAGPPKPGEGGKPDTTSDADVGRVPRSGPAEASAKAEGGPHITDGHLSAALERANDWEALVGGNWLNKAGVLVFVIGLSLFLGYSLTQLGPAGRVAVGWLAGLSLLGGGLVLERKPTYVAFARGLVAGGWAACYFTAFAMFALPAARVIDNPLAGTALLLAVAAAMIAHSLRYRSQTVTALTYVIGFVTLHITPATGFTLLGSIPLAVSLLTLSYRYQWTALGTVGVLSTYAGFVFRLASSVEPASIGELQAAEAMLLTYWLLFEVFDLLEVRRQTVGDLARSLFFLNATGFVGTSMLLWSGQPARSLALLLALTAVLYVVSSLVRARLQGGAARDEEATGLEAAWSGGYEGAITMASVLAALAIGLRFTGSQLLVALLLEGELLLMSGLRLRSRYLRGLASLVLGAATFAAVVLVVSPVHGTFVLFGVVWHDWLPTITLMAAAFYLNHRLVGHLRPVLAEVAYLALGTVLVALIVGNETPVRFQALAWIALSLALLEASIRSGVAELRRHAYAVGALSVVTVPMAWLHEGSFSAWHTLAPSAVLAYVLAIRLSRPAAGIGETERESARMAASCMATGLALAALTSATPAPYAGLAWLGLAWPLAEVGLRRTGWKECAIQAGMVGVAAATYTVMEAGLPGSSSAEHPALMLAGLGALTGLAAIRFFSLGDVARSEQQIMRDGCACVSVAALTLLAPHALEAVLVAGAWALFGLVLLILGLRCRVDGLRLLAYLLGVLGFVRGWLLVVEDHEPWGGVPVRLIVAILVVVTLYAQEFLVPRHWRDAAADAGAAPSGPTDMGAALGRPTDVGAAFRRPAFWIDRYVRTLYSVAATLLAAELLFREASPAMLTVAWALLGLALLAVGFPAREPILRRSGLVLLTTCVVKVLAYDSRALETLARIVSFLLLGAVLIAVSWIYTRFGDRLRRFL